MTLLDAVRRCLQSSGSFEIESIADTDEAERTALLAQEVYEIIADKSHELQCITFSGTLEGGGDLAHPNYLKIPDGVLNVQSSTIRYMTGLDRYGEYKQIKYLSNEDFLNHIQTRNIITQDNTILVNDFGGAALVIRNDTNPTFWTTFDGTHIVFDSYDSSKENTMVEDKSLIIGSKRALFLQDDAYEIPLPEHLMQGFRDVLKNEYYEQIIEESKPSIARRANAFLAKLQQSNRRISDKQRPRRRNGRR